MRHVMIDLETLSTRSDAEILQIGAVEFSADGVLETQAFNINLRAPIINKAGEFHRSPETMFWWSQQPIELREQLLIGQVGFEEGLIKFAAWCQGPPITVWSNGSEFDTPILRHAYGVFGLEPPWNFRSTRCYRTVKNLFPLAKIKPSGMKHRAVDDAISQATHLLEIRDAAYDLFGLDIFTTSEEIAKSVAEVHVIRSDVDKHGY
jgi:hypothetical protein